MNRARQECQQFEKNYGEKMSIEVLARHMAGFIHLHTCYWAYRPFGSAILIGGYDDNLQSFELYTIEQNGSIQKCKGSAIGKGKSSARTEIEKIDLTTHG